jgi:hypothetical protein
MRNIVPGAGLVRVVTYPRSYCWPAEKMDHRGRRSPAMSRPPNLR